MRTCPRCGAEVERRIWCPECKQLVSRQDLHSVRLAGAIGVVHSSSPKIEEYWATGDPAVFD